MSIRRNGRNSSIKGRVCATKNWRIKREGSRYIEEKIEVKKG